MGFSRCESHPAPSELDAQLMPTFPTSTGDSSDSLNTGEVPNAGSTQVSLRWIPTNKQARTWTLPAVVCAPCFHWLVQQLVTGASSVLSTVLSLGNMSETKKEFGNIMFFWKTSRSRGGSAQGWEWKGRHEALTPTFYLLWLEQALWKPGAQEVFNNSGEQNQDEEASKSMITF